MEPPTGTLTESGFRENISIGLQYLESWLRGIGCVPLNNLMEDAATAEISRAQLWQWLNHGVSLTDGRPITRDFFRTILQEELSKLSCSLGEEHFKAGKFREATELFEKLSTSPEFVEFLTIPAYEQLINTTGAQAH